MGSPTPVPRGNFSATSVSCIDRQWRDHLAAMNDMYADINSRPAPAADKAVEFRVESTAAYAAMWTAVWQETVAFFCHLGVEVADPHR